MFGFSIVKPPFGFTDVKTITIPTICSVNKQLLAAIGVSYGIITLSLREKVW